jgi:lipopolysaccharide transport protein LptA
MRCRGSQTIDKQVQIKAQTFEVRDKKNVAVFTSNVHVVKGDSTIRRNSLIVTYLSDFIAAGTAQPGQSDKSPRLMNLTAIGLKGATEKCAHRC